MQVTARTLMMSATAATTTAATAAAADTAAQAVEAGAAADAGTFGALLAAALSPDASAGAAAPGMPEGAGDPTAVPAELPARASEPAGVVAETVPTPELALQMLLTASQATAAIAPAQAPSSDSGALPLPLRPDAMDSSPQAAGRTSPVTDPITDSRQASSAGRRPQDAIAAAQAGEAGEAADAPKPALSALAPPEPPFRDAVRRQLRETELSAAAPAATATAAAPATTELPETQVVRHVSAPLSSARWEQALGEQVLWVARKELQTASLTLNPPELGPVKVELQLNDTQAIASFSSQQPEVRKAIEEALPALKTLFADAGLQLQQANVGSGDAGQPPAQRRQVDDGSGGAAHPDEDAPASTVPAARVRASNRLLDTFA